MHPDSRFHVRTRRDFLRDGLSLAALAATVPAFLSRTASAAALAGVASPKTDGRVLVVVQLSGGNDGLNTVIPYADDVYYQVRPTIAVPAKEVIRLDDYVGLAPGLSGLQPIWDASRLAVVQGVGYPNPDRSHFRSMEIWQTATPDGFVSDGWIGRLFDHTCSNGDCSPTLAVSIAQTLDPALIGTSGVGVAFDDPDRFYRMTQLYNQHAAAPATAGAAATADGSAPAAAAAGQLDFLRRTAMNATLSADTVRTAVAKTHSGVDYPREKFAQELKLVASMIAGGLDTRVYYVTLGGFDTHANETQTHTRLMQTLGSGLKAFNEDLQQLGVADRVVGFTFSEFGRRLKENGSRGTDHGQAAPMFVFGAPVKAGVVGKHPSLTDLAGGDVKYAIDFRQVYATVIRDWLGVDPDAILGGKFASLPLLA